MNKITKLFLDIDDTIIPTGEILCNIYNSVYENHEGYKFADFDNCYKWTMTDVCPLMDQNTMKDIFNSQTFFDEAELFEGMKELIDYLHYEKKLDIIFVSRGEPKNIAIKLEWIHKLFPYSTQIPVVGDWYKEIEKDMINMSGGIFVDDKTANLKTCNADHPILISIGGNFDRNWNCDWERLKCCCVQDLETAILQILHFNN